MENLNTGKLVPIKEKLAFAAANVGNIPIMTITASFLLIFYTDVVGLSPAACATLFLLARVFDGITDPIVGFLMDRFPDGKHGRFRPLLFIGGIICPLNLFLVFVGPYMWTGFALGIAYITYLMLGITFDIMDISLNSLLPVMTPDIKERDSLSTQKGICYLAGAIAVTIISPLVIGDTSRAGGYIILLIVICSLVAILSIIGAIGIKERIKPVKEEKYSAKEMIAILGHRAVLAQFLLSLLHNTGGFIATTVNLFFFAYIFFDITLFSIVAAVGAVAMIPGAALSGVFAARFGKKKTLIYSLSLASVMTLIRLISVANIPLLLVSTFMFSFVSGMTIPLMIGMRADNTDAVELDLGYRAEAAISSLSSFIVKFATGVGGAIPGYLLAWAGYNALLDVQGARANNVLIFCVIVAPPIFNLLGVTALGILYPLNKEKLAEQEVKIKELHAKEITQQGQEAQ